MKVSLSLRGVIVVAALGGAALVSLVYATQVGDVAQGEVIKQDDSSLVLRTDPCDQGSATVSFSFPWRKRSLSKKTCADKSSHEIVQVEQLSAEPTPAPNKPKDGDHPKPPPPKDHNNDKNEPPPQSSGERR